jgi:type II secretory pathway pseudopilin PulG
MIEIMIVILVIGILLAIAVPNWVTTRNRAKAQQCIMNLRRIADAKELRAYDANLATGAPCVMADIYPAYFRTPSLPVCTAGGTYVVQPIGATPTCSVAAPIAHVLP